MRIFKTLLIAVLALLCSTVATAHDFVVDGIYYNILSEEYKTVEVTYEGYFNSSSPGKYSGNFVVPEMVDYNSVSYKVIRIGDNAFYNCFHLTNVTIGNNIISIGEAAFYKCSILTSATIGNNVTSIGESAFNNCSSLPSIEIPNSVTSVGRYAFYRCSGLTSVTIANSVTSIGEYVFCDCSALESIEIPNSVTSIGERAFDGCSSLTSIEIPNSVTSIGGGAFDGCFGLTSVTIGNSVTSIGDYAFFACSGLTSIEIPNSVTSIGGNAFLACSGLTSVTIGNSVTSIGDYAFEDCTGLTSIEIPNSVTSIGSYAFVGCYRLTSIEIPNSVTSIADYAFKGCSRLTSIEIPNSVTSIGDGAFYDCSRLTSIEIPNSVTSIADYAFYDCSGLTNLEIGKNVTSIGAHAFEYCKNITIITSQVPADRLFAPGYAAFYNISNCTLYVPYGAKGKYAATDGWSKFKNIVELPDAFDLTVTSAGYASLYLASAVEIPLDVEVYTATAVEGDLLKMQQVTGILPANTGAIVKADAGTYSFIYSDENPAAIEGNLLLGTTTDTYIKPTAGTAAYVLSQVDGIVGMYLAELNGEGRFLNNANKAYMLLGEIKIEDGEIDTSAPGTQLSAGYRFDFGGTTGVEKVEMRKEKVEIYDLQGRRVEHPTKGLYIVNGRVMLVK